VTKLNGRGITGEPLSADVFGNGVMAVYPEPHGTIVFRPGGSGFDQYTQYAFDQNKYHEM
jgi:hypothetical protein